jgi:hypothetical protein
MLTAKNHSRLGSREVGRNAGLDEKELKKT